MATRPIPYADIVEAVSYYHQAIDDGYRTEGGAGGAFTAHGIAAVRLGLPGGVEASKAMARRLDLAVALGIEVRSWHAVDQAWAAQQLLRYRTYDQEFQQAESRLTRAGAGRSASTRARKQPASAATGRQPADRVPAGLVLPEPAKPEPQLTDLVNRIVPMLRKGPLTIYEIQTMLQCHPALAEGAVLVAQKQGAAIVERAGKWHLDATPAMGSQAPRKSFELVTDKDGYIRFGACGDQHLASKYARLDCLNDYYDRLARKEISIVLSAGNHLDGEASFNKHDLLVHGMDPQLQYLAREYPKRDGIETWAITGEDHEGWWARREGVDVGRYTENVMRQNGRDDWHDLGFMECFIPLVHGDTGKSSQLCLMHPGGGSAYAISYAPQKIVEGFDGGAKPAVLLIGHYHKASYQMTRNVHVLQTGCFQDQTIFMRQRKLAAHLCGWLCQVHVDPDTGAVDEFTCTAWNYFVKDFYKGRWSEHGPVNQAVRSARP